MTASQFDQLVKETAKSVVADDGLSVYLKVDGLQRGHVHELHADDLRSKAGLPLLHPAAYYTLHYIPKP
jgi:hypothetical protein